jgi:hypothetical protein
VAKHLHKSFRDEQARSLLPRYLDREIELEHALGILKIGRSLFFALLRHFRYNPSEFSIVYQRQETTRKISPEIERNILRELRVEKAMIENPKIKLDTYNYTYLRDLLWDKYRQKVSFPAIIKRAKKNDFYLCLSKRKAHDRRVLTNYIGELIQHDSSHHLWTPLAETK